MLRCPRRVRRHRPRSPPPLSCDERSDVCFSVLSARYVRISHCGDRMATAARRPRKMSLNFGLRSRLPESPAGRPMALACLIPRGQTSWGSVVNSTTGGSSSSTRSNVPSPASVGHQVLAEATLSSEACFVECPPSFVARLEEESGISHHTYCISHHLVCHTIYMVLNTMYIAVHNPRRSCPRHG